LKKYRSKYGSADRIQLNDKFANVKDIKSFILAQRAAHNQEEVPFMTTSIKADENAHMGIITDIKTELRDVNALKINYSTRKGDISKDLN